jgi:tRNA(fMet)-specific endonuclease VapC
MIQFLLDTDHLTLYEHGHPALGQRLARQPADSVCLAVVTVEEALRGRLGALSQARTAAQRIARYALLQASVQLVNLFPVVAYTQAAEDQLLKFKAQRLRIGSQDLKIAAVAMVNKLTLLTRNRQDFGRIPGLSMADWSA